MDACSYYQMEEIEGGEMSPERDLWASVLEAAWWDWLHYQCLGEDEEVRRVRARFTLKGVSSVMLTLMRRSAKGWFRSKSTHTGSFLFCAEHLGLNPAAILDRMAAIEAGLADMDEEARVNFYRSLCEQGARKPLAIASAAKGTRRADSSERRKPTIKQKEVPQLKEEAAIEPKEEAAAAPPEAVRSAGKAKVKACSKCKQEKPADKDHFHQNRQGRYGLDAWCKVCKGARNRERGAYRRRLEKEARTRGSVVSEQKERSGTPAKETAADSPLLTLDFTDYPNLLQELKADAKKNFRSPEGQAFWSLWSCCSASWTKTE